MTLSLLDSFRVVGVGRARANVGRAISTKEVRGLVGKAIDVAVQARAAIARQAAPGRALVTETRTPGRIAELLGRMFTDPAGRFSTLGATRAVNEQTSTVRRSAAAIGLDVSSPQSASVLTGTAEVNTQATTVRTSSAEIGLDALSPEAPSVLSSSAQINTAPTSYVDKHLTFTGATTTAELSGVYAGTGAAAGMTTLKLELRNNATIGSVATTVRFRVRDQNNDTIFNFNGSLKAGDVVSLGADIGLSVRFTEGTTLTGAFDTTAVSSSVPTDVDANAAFNDADVNRRPRFENDAQVVAGSFVVNGTTVNVLAGDTINTVLARINATVPGLTASFAGDQVRLETTSASESDVTVGADTSGFLAAVKLASATTVRGNVRDDAIAFAQSGPLGSVASGSFSVNGASISVDRATDTLATVLARINAAGTGATASYDSVTDKATFTPTTAGAPLILGDDTSGFLAAIHVAAGATGKSVAASNPFNGSGMSDPLFDPGDSVVAGSFRVNGALIAVAANDSVSSVLAKINASGAGVTATLSGDRVTLTSNAASEDDLDLDDDTSGFLAATKLAGATTTAGNVRDDEVRFASSQLAAVASGSFAVNGRVVTVDRNVDSLASVLSRINAAAAGVTASYDAAADELVFTPDEPGATLVLDSDTSGLLAAVGVTQGARGTRVRTDNPFEGTGSNDPLFDPGRSVVAGTLQVNGVAIAVAANDSVDSVLAKINASGARVVASFDAATERVNLRATRASSDAIVLGADTSGFFAAVKLDAATESVLGSPATAGLDAVLRDSTAFAAVQAGSIRLNGSSTALDPATMTLRDVVTALDGIPGVKVVADEATSRVRMRADQAGRVVEAADTSGLLAALGVSSLRAVGRAPQLVRTEHAEVELQDPLSAARAAEAAAKLFNQTLSSLSRNAAQGRLREEMLNVARSAIAELAPAVRDAVRFDEDRFGARIAVDLFALRETLREDPNALTDFLEGGLGGGLALALERFDVETEEAAANEPAPAFESDRPLAELVGRELYARLADLGADAQQVVADRATLVRARVIKMYATIAASFAG